MQYNKKKFFAAFFQKSSPVLLAGIAIAAATWGLSIYKAQGTASHSITVAVPHGVNTVVATALQKAGVLDGTLRFRVFSALTAWDGPLRSAEFSFPAHASIERVLAVLRHGRPVQHLLTIPEGLTAARIGWVLSRADALGGEIRLPAEASVLPETYAYQRGVSRMSVLVRAERALDEFLTEAWRTRDSGLGLHSPRELLVLASIVERETHLGQERALVARVFLNRLRLRMRLQSDPTVVYAESGGDGELTHGLNREALARVTPYNTYVVGGLPAGPICAPGGASIMAVAHPARSEALYFVADGTGGHVFADSLAEHIHNVARYRQMTR